VAAARRPTHMDDDGTAALVPSVSLAASRQRDRRNRVRSRTGEGTLVGGEIVQAVRSGVGPLCRSHVASRCGHIARNPSRSRLERGGGGEARTIGAAAVRGLRRSRR
jgi:hypothetical protein